MARVLATGGLHPGEDEGAAAGHNVGKPPRLLERLDDPAVHAGVDGDEIDPVLGMGAHHLQEVLGRDGDQRFFQVTDGVVHGHGADHSRRLLNERAAEGAADLGGLKPLGSVEDALPIDRVSKASTSKRQDLRGVPFVTIDGEDFSVNDVAYYYGSIYNTFANNGSSFGFDSSKSAREQQYTEGKTWHDYFLESALDYMKESVAVAHAAEAAGFDGAEQMDSTEQSNLSMIDLYASYSGATRAQYLTAMFGKYMTEEAFVRCVRRNALASAYQQSYSDSLTYSAADLQAAYDEDPDAYCSVDIEYVSFTTGLSSDATDAEKSAAMEEAKAKAEAVLAAYAEGRSFEESAGDGTYTHLAHADRSVTSDMLTWAFAADRAEGDTTVAEQSSGYVAVLFHSRSRDDYHPVTVRHILVADEQTAADIYSQFNNTGDKTENEFATLAATKSTDSGTASNGGLVSNMRKGAYVQPFEDWSFDPSRQSGDTGIVESEYGFHVMYFVETNELPYWEYKATNTLKSSAVNDWYDAITDGVTAEQLDAIEYVG